MLSPNRYFICLSHDRDPISWDLADDGQRNAPEYYRTILRAVEESLENRGLTFYLTWKLDEIPATGRDVVAIVMGDEWNRYPNYASDVLATFKTYGTWPWMGGSIFAGPWPLGLILFVKHVKTWLHFLPGAGRRLDRRVRSARPLAPVYPLPLGYGNQMDLPIKPMSERTTDLFFAGSVEHGRPARWSPKQLMKNPKLIAREAMLKSVDELVASRSGIRVRVNTMASFALNKIHYGKAKPGEVLDKQEYSDVLMDTRICLCPRGTSPETYRYFEGLRYGCVVVAEPQPDRDFYRGAPVVELRDWRRLPELVDRLLSSPAELERIHEQALSWWRHRCSEPAVATFIVERIEELIGQG